MITLRKSLSKSCKDLRILNGTTYVKGFCSTTTTDTTTTTSTSTTTDTDTNSEKSNKEKLFHQINELTKQSSFNKVLFYKKSAHETEGYSYKERQQFKQKQQKIKQIKHNQQLKQKQQIEQQKQKKLEQQQQQQLELEKKQKFEQQLEQQQREQNQISLLEKSKDLESINDFGDFDFRELETKPLFSVPNV